MNIKSEIPDFEPDAGRYRKKKPQQSKSSKRADHKHEYVKTISMHLNSFSHEIAGYYWSTHCRICGRLGDFSYFDRDEFFKPEFRGRHIFYSGKEALLSLSEIHAKYPEIPIYRNSERFGDPDIQVDLDHFSIDT